MPAGCMRPLVAQYSGNSCERDFSSVTAIIVITGLCWSCSDGNACRKTARICSNCSATFRACFSPAFDTTTKCGLCTSTQLFDPARTAGDAQNANPQARIARYQRVIVGICLLYAFR